MPGSLVTEACFARYALTLLSTRSCVQGMHPIQGASCASELCIQLAMHMSSASRSHKPRERALRTTRQWGGACVARAVRHARGCAHQRADRTQHCAAAELPCQQGTVIDALPTQQSPNQPQWQRALHVGWQGNRARGARRCARVRAAAASTCGGTIPPRSCACREQRVTRSTAQPSCSVCRVPCVQDGAAVARVEGADAAALTAAVAEHIGAAAPRGAAPAAAAAAPAPAAAHAPPAASGSSAPAANGGPTHGGGTAARIRGLLASAPVILFMKVRLPKVALKGIAN